MCRFLSFKAFQMTYSIRPLMYCSLWRREIEMADGVVRPPSNGQHIRREKLPVQGQPREKLALGLSVIFYATNLG
jgi:hypothetical protein